MCVGGVVAVVCGGQYTYPTNPNPSHQTQLIGGWEPRTQVHRACLGSHRRVAQHAAPVLTLLVHRTVVLDDHRVECERARLSSVVQRLWYRDGGWVSGGLGLRRGVADLTPDGVEQQQQQE